MSCFKTDAIDGHEMHRNGTNYFALPNQTRNKTITYIAITLFVHSLHIFYRAIDGFSSEESIPASVYRSSKIAVSQSRSDQRY